MTLSSMTGFARSHGASGPYSFAWEIKSVNAKGLDLRLRLPPGWDAIEQRVRAKAAEALARGTVYANLAVERPTVQPIVRINDQVLAAVLATLDGLSGRVQAELPRLDGILAIKGVVEVVEADEREEDRETAQAAVVGGFAAALADLDAMRRHEGEALGRVLAQRLADIAALVERAEAAPGRKPEAVRERLARQVALLLEASDRFDPDRLHQEAILIAAKADVREELDRLRAHLTQASQLVEKGGAVGRRLDFLAQELNRESNTLCAKANDIELSKIGLELKSVVEQFREQVQNLE
ncbi:MAG TPA: YicC/YloC family endoribonuclease [Rhodoplanes sp.]|nr:YicC/YloC family endoribonuclease [Rhodoplanes sp.]